VCAKTPAEAFALVRTKTKFLGQLHAYALMTGSGFLEKANDHSFERADAE
jgi:hypothetical protein